MTSFADGGSGPPGGLDGGNFKCPDCPEFFQTPAARYNHRRSYHAGERQKESPIGDSPIAGPPVVVQGVDTSENWELDRPTDITEIMAGLDLHPFHDLTRQFAYVLHYVAPGMATVKKRQIIQAFNENLYRINADPPSMLGRFLDMCGLMTSQSQYIKRVLLGVDDPPPSPYGAQYVGGPQAITWDPYTGQYVTVPIVMLPGNQIQPPQYPYYYPFPYWPPQ